MDEANQILHYMIQHHYATSDGRPTEKAKAAITEGITAIPAELDRVKEQIAAAILHDEDITAESLAGTPYWEPVTVDKTVSYEEAAELIEHFEREGYISKSGEIKESMKKALVRRDAPSSCKV